MRTYEDVKETLEIYEAELKRESNIKRDHFIIMGGNVNVVRKGVGNYALEKGNPVPLIWETAKKKHAEFQEKCGDNIRLEIIKYSDWLIKNIEECKKLIKCMRKQFSSNVDPHESAPESLPESTVENTESVSESTMENTDSGTDSSVENTESTLESTAENTESAPESIAETPEPPYEPIELPQSPAGPSHTARQLDDVSCPSCPYGIKTCMVCKFASGINMNVFPWEIICSVPNRTVKNKSQKSC